MELLSTEHRSVFVSPEEGRGFSSIMLIQSGVTLSSALRLIGCRWITVATRRSWSGSGTRGVRWSGPEPGATSRSPRHSSPVHMSTTWVLHDNFMSTSWVLHERSTWSPEASGCNHVTELPEGRPSAVEWLHCCHLVVRRVTLNICSVLNNKNDVSALIVKLLPVWQIIWVALHQQRGQRASESSLWGRRVLVKLCF